MENNQEQYPSFFFNWDQFLLSGKNPGFFEPEEFQEIIEIYITEDKLDRARKTIRYAFRQYPDNKEMLYEILLLLNDYELWNDLFNLSKEFEAIGEVWGDGHRLTALLHLGMEEEAFLYFKKLKQKYKDSIEDIIVIYQAMGEALMEVDLFDSSIDVIKEGISITGEDVDFFWLLLQNYSSVGNKETAMSYADKIQKSNPLDAESWHRLGEFYTEIEDYENAIEALENAHSLGYDSPKSQILLIRVYELNHNYNKVLQKAKEYLNLYSNDYLILITAANACQQMEKWEEAGPFISSAIRLQSDMDALYLFQSTVFLQLGEVVKAISALKNGISATNDPNGDLQKELDRLKKEYL